MACTTAAHAESRCVSQRLLSTSQPPNISLLRTDRVHFAEENKTKPEITKMLSEATATVSAQVSGERRNAMKSWQ